MKIKNPKADKPAKSKAKAPEYDSAPIAMSKDEEFVAATPCGARDCAVAKVVTWEGKRGLDIRRYYLAEDETWKPTGKGLRLPFNSKELVRFVDELAARVGRE